MRKRRLRADADYDQRGYLAECHEPSVYFIRQGALGPIKIGHTNNIKRRLMNLQPGNPHPLRVLVLVPGSRGDERAYHEKYRHLRVGGEWFTPSTQLLAEIKDLTSRQKGTP